MAEHTAPRVVELSGSDRPVLIRDSDTAAIAGTAFRLTPTQLALADAYEGESYARIPVELGSASHGWR